MSTVSREAFEQQDAFGIGAPNDAYAQYFTGQSYLKPLTAPGACPVFLANVTFEPGCRNNWHIHHASRGGGQLLICTAGEGWYQDARHGYHHPGGGQALARSEGEQLVQSHRRRGSRREHPERMVRAGLG